MTWMETKRLYLDKGNLFEDLANDGPEWQNRLHVADPTQLGKRFDDDDNLDDLLFLGR